MLLKNTGVQIELSNPVDIARFKSLGWKEVEVKPLEVAKVEEVAPVVPVEPVAPPAEEKPVEKRVKKAVKHE